MANSKDVVLTGVSTGIFVGRSRPRGTEHCETEGALRGHSATVQELGSAQTPSCEDARRPTRKDARAHKAVRCPLSESRVTRPELIQAGDGVAHFPVDSQADSVLETPSPKALADRCERSLTSSAGCTTGKLARRLSGDASLVPKPTLTLHRLSAEWRRTRSCHRPRRRRGWAPIV
jgi:hypothetical protein